MDELTQTANYRRFEPIPPFLFASGPGELVDGTPSSQSSSDAPLTAVRILVVDDQILPSDPLVRLLACEGFEVDCAATGAEGLVLAAARSYRAIVLDLCLPDVPGLVVLARLRARGNNAPVLVLTAFGELQSACAAGRLGAARFMSKPVFFDLGAALREIINPAGTRPADAQRSPQPDAYASVEALAIAALLEQLDDLRLSDAPARETPRGCNGATTRDRARQRLLTVLVRAVSDPALPVPCFAACAKALRRAVTTRPTESPDVTATFAADLVLTALGYTTTDPRVTTAIDRIRAAVSAHRHLAEDAIAQDLSVHPSHVGRILKTETGLSFRHWRSGFLMKAVVSHLVGTREQVAQIAYRQLGYEHASQLDREFHSMFGFSPREFRRLWQTAVTRN